MNKRGIFFTLLAVALIFLFFASFPIYYATEQRKAIQARVNTMNSFLSTVEDDLKREIYILGYRVIFLIEQNISSSLEYVENVSGAFQEAFYTGTITGINDSHDVLKETNLSEMKERINLAADKQNIDLEFIDAKIEVTQNDEGGPWNVLVIMRANISMKDKAGLASWDTYREIKTKIEIEYFEDPLYIVGTQHKVPQMINKSVFTVDQLGSVENLSAFFNNRSYIASPYAPSFLMRLEGNFSNSSCCGIESLVDKDAIKDQGFDIEEDKVSMDYCYFDSGCLLPIDCKVIGVAVYLDTDHLTLYDPGSNLPCD